MSICNYFFMEQITEFENNKKVVGVNVLLNVYDCNSQLLSNRYFISHLLIKLVEISEMTPIYNSLHVYEFPAITIDKNGNPKITGDVGMSGGIILVESHIYIHTWPEKNYARIEISTCKDVFNEQKINEISNFIKTAVNANNVEIKIVH